MRGAPIPCYPHLRLGLPAGRTLRRLWRGRRPDLVHIATEGPLGWSALRAARDLDIAVSSDFRTNFQAYSGHYRLGWLRGAIAAYLRRFHNRQRLHDGADRGAARANCRRPASSARWSSRAAWTRNCSTRRGAARRCAGSGVWPATTRVVLYVGRLAAEKNLDLLLQAFAAMRQVDPRTRLVLVGDGPLRDSLRQRCPHGRLCRPAQRRRPGGTLCVGRPVRLSQPDRDLRQRHARGHGQRPAGAGFRPCRGGTVDRARSRTAGSRHVRDAAAFVQLAQRLAGDRAPPAARGSGRAAQRARPGLGRHRAPDRNGLHLGADCAPRQGPGVIVAGALGVCLMQGRRVDLHQKFGMQR